MFGSQSKGTDVNAAVAWLTSDAPESHIPTEMGGGGTKCDHNRILSGEVGGRETTACLMKTHERPRSGCVRSVSGGG